MVDRLQKYLVAVVAGVLAVLSLGGVILSLTLLRPAQEVIATVTPHQPIVMTRGGVLPLFASDVTVTVHGKPSQTVALAVGTTSDVVGWIGDAAYTEVIGLESDREHLKVLEHESQVEAPQSDTPQSDLVQQPAPIDTVQSDASQSAGTTQQDLLAMTMVANDMWIQTAEGKGEASLKLTEVDRSISVLAASDTTAPEMTLTWNVKSTNVLLIVFSVLASVFTLSAVAYVLRQIVIDRSRVQRALDIEARRRADLTDTQSISLAEIADYAARMEAENTLASKEAAEENDLGESPDKSLDAIDDLAGLSAIVGAEVSPKVPSSTGAAGTENSAEDVMNDGEVERSDEMSETRPSRPSHSELPTRTLTISGVRSLDDNETHENDGLDSVVSDGAVQTTSRVSQEQGEVYGRHSMTEGPIEVDPPETIPTDTGTIDLTAIRPGAVLPSRRALREARERGESALVIDGHEFDTGLIPQIRRVSGATAVGDSALADESASTLVEAQVDEYIHAEESPNPTPVASRDDAESQGSGWRSVISTFRSRNQDSTQENS